MLIANPVLANLLMLLIILGGIISSYTMVREIFPDTSLGIIEVKVAYSGADPEEIEEGICFKIEDALDGISGIKDVILTASEGVATAHIECENNASISEVKEEVKTAVDSISTFPKGAERPLIKELKVEGDVLSIALWGNLPDYQLKEAARELRRDLLNIKGITKIEVQGEKDYEISVEIPEESLRKYNLSFKKIGNSIAENSLNTPVGTIKSNTEEARIRSVGRKYYANDYKNIPIIATDDGKTVTLGELGALFDKSDDSNNSEVLFNGMPAVIINVYKTNTQDSIYISEQVTSYVKQLSENMPYGFKTTVFKDFSRMVKGRLNTLKYNGIAGLLLVIFILWLFLDIRLSFWVAMGIPISIAGGLAVMGVVGSSINMLTMFGLIMVLGLIVDDAIVVGEAIYTRRESGEGPINSAVNGTSEVTMPVIAAVLTTIVAFIPLFFVEGIIGKFIRQIPIPVVAALSISIIESLFILPVHLRHLPLSVHKPKFKFLKYTMKLRSYVIGGLNYFIENIYLPFLKLALRERYVVASLFIMLLLVIFGLVNGGYVKYVFMPESDNDFIRARIELPPGSSFAEVKKIGEELLVSWGEVEKLYNEKYSKDLAVAKVTTLESGNLNIAELTIELIPSEERNLYYMDILQQWKKETGKISGAVAESFDTFQRGPGGKPIEIKLFANNRNLLTEASDKLIEKLDSIDGVFDAQSDYRNGIKEYLVRIKPEAYHLGVSLQDISEHMRSVYFGNEPIRIQRGMDDVRVKVRYPALERNTLDSLDNIRIPLLNGKMVPLSAVADITVTEGVRSIRRQNRLNTVSVEADVNFEQANSEEIIKNLTKYFLPKLASEYNVKYSFEGQTRETSNSMRSLMFGFPIALFAIYFIIASLFKSYIQPFIVMITIPFGLIGAVLGHLIFGMDLTIMSMFGMVALSGIVVNDAIVLIEGINSRLEAGSNFLTAVSEGSKRRFRAILLTTLTTFFGLMPMILEKSVQAQFIIPMAVSIAFGVAFATVVTLVLIPSIIVILNDIRRLIRLLWFMEKISMEEAEPRYRQTSNKT